MVEKLKVYLESSFISYLTGRETTDVKIASWQALSRKWWKDEAPRCELNVSVFVLNDMANPYTLPITKKVIEAAGYACPLITTPERFLEDTEK